MEEFKESIKDLKKQMSDFIDNYYKELITLWKELTELKTKLSLYSLIFGGASGIVFSVISYFIINALKK